jgi:hypothetical protein
VIDIRHSRDISLALKVDGGVFLIKTDTNTEFDLKIYRQLTLTNGRH